MMNDTVREELQTKISTGTAVRREPQPERPAIADPPTQGVAGIALQPARAKTANLTAPKTSPTLVEFQQKSTALPDWRLQLQNAVQQRKGSQTPSAERQPLAVTAAVTQRPQPVPQNFEQQIETADPRVANAMRRISESRKAFLEPDVSPKLNRSYAPTQPSRPFGVVSPGVPGTAAARAASPAPAIPKPRLVDPPPVLKRDTNKLPRIEISEPLLRAEPIPSSAPKGITDDRSAEFAEITRIHIRADEKPAEDVEWPVTETEEIEDLAPFSMRFGAGLFDFIIGTFASMVLLSPIAFTSGDWFTATGLLTFAGTTGIVMFLYLTLCLGFLGKSVGMKLFSLELVDAVENEYPTLRQAAVNTAVFLLSVLFLGAGFIAVFYNEEKRALHDLLSGTILVREF